MIMNHTQYVCAMTNIECLFCFALLPQAKQRASVKWLLSKAFNNRVPENLKEPFYRDHEGQDHLKPQVINILIEL